MDVGWLADVDIKDHGACCLLTAAEEVLELGESVRGHGALTAGTLELLEDEAVAGGGIGKRVVERDVFVESDVEGLAWIGVVLG